MLDEGWCPIVQVHGLFEDIQLEEGRPTQCGLLMELYGVSLYDVLQEGQHAHAERKLGRALPPFTNEHRRTVAHNVASACRYLHDLGIMHRDLKDCNVLVDPFNKYRAKLTDFGARFTHARALRALRAAPRSGCADTARRRHIQEHASGVPPRNGWHHAHARPGGAGGHGCGRRPRAGG